MQIGILGAGVVGQSLAKAVVPLGHDVMLSSRTPQRADMQALADDIGVRVGTVDETVAFGEILAVALSWDAVPDVVTQGDWSGKVVIDATNRFDANSSVAAGQELARLVPTAHVVKALNTIGAEHYQDPIFDGQAATMLIAGDSREAKATVTQLLTQMRFEVVDTGGIDAATHLEALAALWVHLAFRTGQGRDTAFRLIHK